MYNKYVIMKIYSEMYIWDWVVRIGELEVVKWLYDNDVEGCMNLVMNGVVVYGKF